MKSTSDYPITQKFGYDPSYPLHNGFHQGTDYGCPDGTPIVVNGVQIGVSGHSGTACWGPHCHVGRFDAAGNVLDSSGRGWSFNSAKVVAVSSDSINGNWVRVLGDGNYYVYLHMSQQTCRQGQILTQPVEDKGIMNEEDAKEVYRSTLHREPENDQVWRNLVGKRFSEVSAGVRGSAEWLTQNHILLKAFTADEQRIGELSNELATARQAATPPAPFKYERLPNDGLNVQTKHDSDVISLDDGTSKGIAEKGTKFVAIGKATDQLSQTHAVYYMSAESFGDADTSGVPAHNQGINTIDLEPAPVETPPAPVAVAATDDEHIDVKVVPASPDAWQNSYSDEGAGDYEAEADTIVHDLAGTVGDVKLAKGMPIKIAGTFTGPDFIKYRRTVKSVERGDWRGIPTAALKDDDGIFTYLDPLIDDFKEFKGQVSARKKVIIATAKAHGEFNWLADRLKKKGSTK